MTPTRKEHSPATQVDTSQCCGEKKARNSHVLYDETIHVLQHVAEGQPRVQVIDSVLSEEGVMGFEYGYSTTDPTTLVVWEAQYGDFANGAQIMIDNFISAAESKWGQPSGLVMLLQIGRAHV